jgi:pimeloyl-ACP methyl ester carboxylesterase
VCPSGFARQFAAALATGDMRPRLRHVRVPTLVVHGTSDGIFNLACGRATAEAIPNASFRVIEGWGHDLAEGVWDRLVDTVGSHLVAHRAA